MRRNSNTKLWTLFLMLALIIGSGATTTPRIARADYMPGEAPPPPPPEPGAGDPDFPTNTGRSPKPGSQRGVVRPPVTADRSSVRQNQVAMWWMGFRMAFLTMFRGFFRF